MWLSISGYKFKPHTGCNDNFKKKNNNFKKTPTHKNWGLSHFFTRKPLTPHPLYLYLFQTPQGFQIWCRGSNWDLQNRNMKSLQLDKLGKWALPLTRQLCRAKEPASTSDSKGSIGGAVVQSPWRTRKAGQFQSERQESLLPEGTFTKTDASRRKLKTTKQKFEQRINSLVVGHFYPRGRVGCTRLPFQMECWSCTIHDVPDS